MDPRPRLLLIGPETNLLNGVLTAAEVDRVSADPAAVADRLRDGKYTAIVAAPEIVAGLLDRFRRDELIIGHIDKGIAVLDLSGTITWVNAGFRKCAVRDPLGQHLLDALGSPRVVSVETDHDEPATGGPPGLNPNDPLAHARRGQSITLRLHRVSSPDQPYLDADIRPVLAPNGTVLQLIANVRNVTAEVIQQQKLDALHSAGQELARLDARELSDMNIPSRTELLKKNLHKCVHDLLHYDTIEVRVLDRDTNKLNLLLQEGMTPEAAGRILYAEPTGNGVTGYVASSGKSYLCPDTASDPLYLKGAEGANSSMTVPLKYQDEVIGTLNVESPRLNGFGPNDLQFTELFSKEVAAALHTLELLSAQVGCTASKMIEEVNKKIALPIDNVLASASMLLGKLGSDLDVADHLRRILEDARRVKESITKVGNELSADPTSGVIPSRGYTPLRGRRILVVDSIEQFRRQAHLMLAQLGATVETAATAAAGLAMAADTLYDAIFLDVKPPDMGGYESYCRFRTARPDSVLALTTGYGYDECHVIPKARADGLKKEHILFKPFLDDQITRAVLDAASPSPPITLASGA